MRNKALIHLFFESPIPQVSFLKHSPIWQTQEICSYRLDSDSPIKNQTGPEHMQVVTPLVLTALAIIFTEVSELHGQPNSCVNR